ncbi:MAG: CooT family nickel-binding protein [Thermacetogeniaceae bacterium]|jgi:predicted RNA-binding protein
MCESNAYLRKGETDEVVLLNVDRIKPVEEGLLLEDIFGTRKVINARIKELALLDHKIILEEV